MKSSDLTGLQMKMLNAICRMVKVKWTNRATTTSLLVSPSHQSRPSSVDLLVSQMVKLRDVPTSTNSAPTSMLNRFFASVASVVPPKQREAISGGAVRVRQLWLTGWHWCANKTWVVAITGVVLLLPLQIGAALEQGPPAQPH